MYLLALKPKPPVAIAYDDNCDDIIEFIKLFRSDYQNYIRKIEKNGEQLVQVLARRSIDDDECSYRYLRRGYYLIHEPSRYSLLVLDSEEVRKLYSTESADESDYD